MSKKNLEPLVKFYKSKDFRKTSSLIGYFTQGASALLGEKVKEIIVDIDNCTISIATPMCNNPTKISKDRGFSLKLDSDKIEKFAGTYELKKLNEDDFGLVRSKKEF